MDLLVLKVPPERVGILADALERDMDAWPDRTDTSERKEILTWLRYRLALWDNRAAKYRTD